MLGKTIGRASATVTPRRTTGTRRTTEALLCELGQIVSEHADEGYASLESEPRFWALVSHLHLRHHETRWSRKSAPDTAGDAKAEEPVEAEVVETASSLPKEAAAEAPKDAAAEAPKDAAVEAPKDAAAEAPEEHAAVEAPEEGAAEDGQDPPEKEEEESS